jgi:hypothetical protein
MTLIRQRWGRAIAIAMALAALVVTLGAPAGSAQSDRTVPVRVVEVERDTGFDWGDAGIGATAAIALGAIGAGATVAARSRASNR